MVIIYSEFIKSKAKTPGEKSTSGPKRSSATPVSLTTGQTDVPKLTPSPIVEIDPRYNEKMATTVSHYVTFCIINLKIYILTEILEIL